MWRSRRKKMTDAEANALLHLLSDHFRQPVMPLGRFCSAMRTWMRCIEQNNANSHPDDLRHGWRYYKHLNTSRSISANPTCWHDSSSLAKNCGQGSVQSTRASGADGLNAASITATLQAICVSPRISLKRDKRRSETRA
jgi:hypothetical protein